MKTKIRVTTGLRKYATLNSGKNDYRAARLEIMEKFNRTTV